MEKTALNKYEKFIKDKMGPAEIKKITGLKDLSKMDESSKARLHDHIRNQAKQKADFASEVADKTKKKLPSGVERTKGKIFGLLPGKKKTTFGTGSQRVTPDRENVRQAIGKAKLRNDRKLLKNRLTTPETAIGGGLGYIVGKHTGSEEKKRNKALGTLGGAAIGNVLGNQIRKYASLDTDNIKRLGMKKLDLKPTQKITEYNKINKVDNQTNYKGGEITNEIKGNSKGNSGPVFSKRGQGGQSPGTNNNQGS